MANFRAFFARKRSGFYCTVAALAFAVAGLVFFFITMQQQGHMYAGIAIITAVGLAAGLVTGYRDYFRILSILSAVMYLLAGCLFLVTQLENIGYAITDTNIGDGIMASFVIGMIFYAASVLFGVIAACLRQEKINQSALAEK